METRGKELEKKGGKSIAAGRTNKTHPPLPSPPLPSSPSLLSSNCFTKYNEYFRCVAQKGEGAPECEAYQKAYRSLCPAEWLAKWAEQRESGAWPGKY